MLQSTKCYNVLYVTKYYMLQSTKCYKVLDIKKYYMLNSIQYFCTEIYYE